MENERTGSGIFQIIKGVAFALFCAFLSAVTFAVVLRTNRIADKAIYPINQTIKILCVCIGSLVFIRGEKGYLKGIAVGLLFSALSYLTFSSLGGDFSLSWLLIAELLLTALAGLIGGALGVNFGRN